MKIIERLINIRKYSDSLTIPPSMISEAVFDRIYDNTYLPISLQISREIRSNIIYSLLTDRDEI
jgi:hypothetical protein